MDTKTCSRCKQLKSIEEFGVRRNGVPQPYCRECVRVYGREHYKNNKSKYIDRNKRFRYLVQEWYIQYKETLRCSKCGENHPATLDFHHNDPSHKEFNIARYYQSAGSITRLEKEIEKCSVLCANCHRKLHWEEKYGTDGI